MSNLKKRLGRRAGLIGIALALGIALAACGGKDEKKEAAPQASSALTEETTPPPIPTDQPDLTNTPSLAAEAALFERAADQARTDLAARLAVSVSELKVLPPDVLLTLPQPLQCPTVGAEGITAYYVYVQYQRFIYPYQFYAAQDTPDEPVVEACGDTLIDQEVLYVPTPDARAQIIAQVKDDLLRQGINPESGEYTVLEMSWNDNALGCAAGLDTPMPPPALIPGYLVTYTLNGVTYEYHTDDTGTRVEFCQPPIGYASADAFIYTLKQDPDVVIEETDEAARYQGLDRDGVIVLLTPQAYRVGLFTFETPAAARIAASQIDDARVSQIFASGYVLIVQEEFSPQVYASLLKYAQQVRSPVLERQATPIPTAEATETAQ